MADTFSYSNFGPLTTSFSAPADCSTEKWLGFDSHNTRLAWGENCSGLVASCYPELRTHDGTNVDINDSKLFRNRAYEPGLFCPDGFSAAISVTKGISSTPDAFGDYVRTLRSHSIATACCPSGYWWSTPGCVRTTTSLDSRPGLISSAGTCSTSSVPEFAGSIGTHTSTVATLVATPVLLIRDLRSSYNIPTSASTSALTDTTSKGNSAGTGSAGGGLSTGGKIAIGVCIPLAVILLVAALFIWRHRRTKPRKAQEIAESAHVAELDGGRFELEGGSTERSYRVAELNQEKDNMRRAELPAEFQEFAFHDKDSSEGLIEADEGKDDFGRQTEPDGGKDESQRGTDANADNTHER